MLQWQWFLSLVVAWPQSSLVDQMVLASEENTCQWKDGGDRRSSRTETRSSIEGAGWGRCHLKHVKTVVCARRLQLLPYIVRNLPMRSCMGLQMEGWAASQAVNADIQMNRSSGAVMTQYKSCNHDRAAAKDQIKYQIGVIGSECDEVRYEKIWRKELTDVVTQDWILFCRNKL